MACAARPRARGRWGRARAAAAKTARGCRPAAYTARSPGSRYPLVADNVAVALQPGLGGDLVRELPGQLPEMRRDRGLVGPLAAQVLDLAVALGDTDHLQRGALLQAVLVSPDFVHLAKGPFAQAPHDLPFGPDALKLVGGHTQTPARPCRPWTAYPPR